MVMSDARLWREVAKRQLVVVPEVYFEDDAGVVQHITWLAGPLEAGAYVSQHGCIDGWLENPATADTAIAAVRAYLGRS